MIEQYQWIENHPKKYEKIAKKAYKFARKFITESGTLKRINTVFKGLSLLEEGKPSLLKKANNPSAKKLANKNKKEANLSAKINSKKEEGKSPYHQLAPSKFWKTGVAAQPIEKITNLITPKFSILSTTKLTTAGSCFAQHLTQQLRKRNYAVLDGEPGPPTLTLEESQKFGFRLYSARYGNIYTIRQLYQLYLESLGHFKPVDAIWKKGEKYFDALRPGIEPYGVNTPEFVQLQRKQHLVRVKKVFHQADVFLFTFGLTEGWEHIESGTIYPIAPGAIAGNYNPEKVRFKNFTFNEIRDDFLSFRNILKKHNPNVKFLLTVSPVHLVATGTENHVLVASVYSKSVLRAVVGQLVKELEDVDYFPSYEIITSPSTKGKFYKDNMRAVTAEGVNCVMDAFFKIHQRNIEHQDAKEDAIKMAIKGASQIVKEEEIICELALLEAFQK